MRNLFRNQLVSSLSGVWHHTVLASEHPSFLILFCFSLTPCVFVLTFPTSPNIKNSAQFACIFFLSVDFSYKRAIYHPATFSAMQFADTREGPLQTYFILAPLLQTNRASSNARAIGMQIPGTAWRCRSPCTTTWSAGSALLLWSLSVCRS